MDSVSLIIAALIAGTTKAASDIAPDTYQALKSLIKRRFAGKPLWSEIRPSSSV